MLRLKAGVKLRHLQPPLVLAITGTCVPLFADFGLDCTVTSCNDSKHSATSLHFSGCAVDLRTRHIPTTTDKKLTRDRLNDALGDDFDVLLEGEGTPNEHIHLEWQPKGS